MESTVIERTQTDKPVTARGPPNPETPLSQTPPGTLRLPPGGTSVGVWGSVRLLPFETVLIPLLPVDLGARRYREGAVELFIQDRNRL